MSNPIPVNLRWHYVWKQKVDGHLPQGPYGNTESGVRSLGIREITHDGGSVGPQWRSIIANGGNATTDFNASTVEVVELNGTYLVMGIKTYWPSGALQSDQWTSIAGNYIIPDNPNAVSSGFGDVVLRADNLALTRYYQKLASVHSVFKGMVFGGELSQTLHAIRNPLKSFRKGIGDYLDHVKRHGPRLPRSKRPSFVRDTWLEYSFGWRPLCSDIESAIDNFYHSQLVKPLFEFIKADSGLIRASYSVTPRSIHSDWDLHTRSWDQIQIKEASVRYYGVYRSTGNGIANPRSWGFDPTEFVPTLWELIPYSFLVDYFTNAGDIISSWSYRFLSPDWTSRGELRQSISKTARGQIIPDPGRDNLYSSGSLGMSTLRSKLVARSRNVILGIPSFELQVPGIGTKWINIAALSKQLSSTRSAIRS